MHHIFVSLFGCRDVSYISFSCSEINNLLISAALWFIFKVYFTCVSFASTKFIVHYFSDTGLCLLCFLWDIKYVFTELSLPVFQLILNGPRTDKSNGFGKLQNFSKGTQNLNILLHIENLSW